MGTSFKGLLRRSYQCQLQFTRYRNKINITKPRPLHFERSVVETICVPYFKEKKPPPYIPLFDKCEERLIVHKKEEAPMVGILAKEVIDWFNKSKLIAIFHKNFMDEEDTFEHYVYLKNHGIKVFSFNKEVMRKATIGTIYEPINIFYQSPHTIVGVCKDPKIHMLMNILKKLPLLTLMGAVVNNNRLLKYNELQTYGKLKTIDEARMALMGVLSSPQQKLVSQINHHPNSLVQSLKLIQDKGGEKK